MIIQPTKTISNVETSQTLKTTRTLVSHQGRVFTWWQTHLSPLLTRIFAIATTALASIFCLFPSHVKAHAVTTSHTYAITHPLLQLLHITPSEQSIDYVANKKQFQLHTLLTEQRHPKTWDLSRVIKADSQQGIKDLLSVDLDISTKFSEMAKNTAILEQAVNAVERAIIDNNKIYIYGCGATGRLAKQVESSFWRPFWSKLQTMSLWDKLKDHLPDIEDTLIGEMTGADRALISSLEGFEDLQLIGKLQLQEHHIQAGDAVFAITEGGETSSVIGTVLSALEQYQTPEKAKENLFFVYNNPDEVLLPFDRSRSVLDNDNITKIRLFTGPQSITGSTRMQATTSETFVMGIILEHAICRVLQKHLTTDELQTLGFDIHTTLSQRLMSFIPVQQAVHSQSSAISRLTDIEAATYAHDHFATYFAKDALITVFTDATERSPTFKLYPLDTIYEPTRKAWIQVWTPAENIEDAWQKFLGRPFSGLDPAHYEEPFKNGVADPYLQQAALTSLKKGGNDQQYLYDFSYSANNSEKRGPNESDLGVLILMDEEIKQGAANPEWFQKWLQQFTAAKANVGVILVSSQQLTNDSAIVAQISALAPQAHIIQLPVNTEQDPLGVRQHIGLKMLLNAHSTGVMTKLGRVIGNTMANVHPGNLKLYGRATFLIQSHVNDRLPKTDSISYAEANAVLFDAIEYVKQNQKGGQQISEVALSIIRLLEASRSGKFVSWEQAEKLWRQYGLEAYMHM